MKVTVLYPGSVLDRNGAAKVVRGFADKADSLSHLSGHEVNVIDSTLSSIIQSNNRNTKISFTSRFKKLIFDSLGENFKKRYSLSYRGKKKLVERKYWRRSQRLIDNNKSIGLDNNAFIFHETFTCWAYINTCRKLSILTYCV